MIIGLVGLKGSGKTTAAQHLQKVLPDAQIKSFANPLKESAKILFNLTDDDVYTSEGKQREVFTSIRYQKCALLDGLGTLFGITREDYINNIYVDLVDMSAHDAFFLYIRDCLRFFTNQKLTVRQILQRHGTDAVRNHFGEDFWIERLFADEFTENTIIDDCRFVNEATKIKEEGGKIIGICRPGLIPDEHPSELEMWSEWDKMVDVTITNSDSLEALYAQLEKALEED